MILSDPDQSHLAHGHSHDNPYLFYDDQAIMCVQSVSRASVVIMIVMMMTMNNDDLSTVSKKWKW